MDASYKFVDFILNTRYEDLPQAVIDTVKMDFMDCLGNLLGGCSEPEVTKSLSLIREIGGRADARVLPYSGRVPADNAAFVMGQMINVLDFDDTNEEAIAHIGAPIFAALAAMSQRCGGISGKEAITVMAVALELSSRLGKYAYGGRGSFDRLPVLGFFSAAAVAGRILGLSKDGLHNALGIAFHQAAGNNQAVVELADTKAMSGGIGAKGGIFAALLAQKGYTGAKNVFDEAPMSYMYFYEKGCDRDGLTANLGEKYDMLALSFKPFACSRGCQKYVDAFITLAEENNISAEEVTGIRYTSGTESLKNYLPSPENIAPANMLAGKFSVPWVVSCGIARKKVGIAEFSAQSRSDPQLLRLAASVQHTLDESIDGAFAQADIAIETTRGTFTAKTGIPKGDPRKPMSREDMLAKLSENAQYGWKGYSADKIAQISGMCSALEESDNICDIFQIITDD